MPRVNNEVKNTISNANINKAKQISEDADIRIGSHREANKVNSNKKAYILPKILLDKIPDIDAENDGLFLKYSPRNDGSKSQMVVKFTTHDTPTSTSALTKAKKILKNDPYKIIDLFAHDLTTGTPEKYATLKKIGNKIQIEILKGFDLEIENHAQHKEITALNIVA